MKFVNFLLVVVMVLGISSCTVQKKPQQKVVEKQIVDKETKEKVVMLETEKEATQQELVKLQDMLKALQNKMNSMKMSNVAVSSPSGGCGNVALQISAPKEGALGHTYITELKATAKSNVANVFITAHVPSTAAYEQSTPRGTQKGDLITWYFKKLDRGQSVPIKVYLKPKTTGEINLCAAIKADCRYCSTTYVGQPILNITKNGPAEALIGAKVTYTIVVKNIGTAAAKDVVMYDTVPPTFNHESGKSKLSFPIGTLAPKASKSFKVTFTTTKRGKYTNHATATASNAKSVKAQATTVIQSRDLNVTFKCPKVMYLGKPGRNEILLGNEGDVPLTNVVITAVSKPGVQIRMAKGGEVIGNTKAVWKLPRLEARQKLNYMLITMCKAPGQHCVDVTVTCNEGITKREKCCTDWRGFPALLIELVDDPDPLLIDEITTYTIVITNQGTAQDDNVYIEANLPEELVVVSAKGSTKENVKPRTVVFAPYPVLKPKEKITFVIKAKAVKVGDARLKVQLFSKLLEKPVNEEESTHVY